VTQKCLVSTASITHTEDSPIGAGSIDLRNSGGKNVRQRGSSRPCSRGTSRAQEPVKIVTNECDLVFV